MTPLQVQAVLANAQSHTLHDKWIDVKARQREEEAARGWATVFGHEESLSLKVRKTPNTFDTIPEMVVVAQ